jgi:hypothetical protein
MHLHHYPAQVLRRAAFYVSLQNQVIRPCKSMGMRARTPDKLQEPLQAQGMYALPAHGDIDSHFA